MASTVIQLVPVNKLTTGWALSQSEAADLGAYKTLGVQFQVLTPGTGTGGDKLELTHSATIDGEYLPVPGANVLLDSTGQSTFIEVTGFLRYVSARVTGSVAGSPVVGAALVAKD